ncbi:MAG: alpha/beta hydrolase [Candidatus Obscuribacterales bacterium]|nr:alpha/beta hydrolase [Candidatus Obscuribacterales bacterium]
MSKSTTVDWKTLPVKTRVIVLTKMLVRAFLIALLLVSVGSYTLFSPPVLIPLLGAKILLYPHPPGDPYNYTTLNGLKAEDVFIKNAAGNKIHGWYWKVPGARKTILFMHGNAGNIGHRLFLAQAILETGTSLFLFDYSGYGKSEGKPGLNELISDSDLAFNFLVDQQKIPPSEIVLYGESIGGTVACDIARKHECAGLILDSTFTSIVRLAKVKIPAYKMFPDFLQPTPSLNVIDYVSQKHPPLLLLHGGKDEIIPTAEAQENFASASQPKKLVLLPLSTHNSKGKDWAAYVQALKEFIASLPQ